MMKHEHALTLSARLAGPAAATSVSPSAFEGSWENQMGSTMDIDVDGSAISGRYTSSDSSSGEKTTGDLTGWINGHVIAFVVNWPTPAITGWAGHLVEEREGTEAAIETLWTLPMEMTNPDDATKLWSSVFAGADRFTRPELR